MTKKINPFDLPSLPIPERYNLPRIGAVYFVISESNHIEYIGAAKDLHKRWRKHECCIDLDNPKLCRIAWLEIIDDDERIATEKQMIRQFLPKINDSHIPRIKTVTNAVSGSAKNLLTTNEAAKKLNVSPIRVRQLIREGKIEAQRVGRDYVIAENSLDSVKTYGKTGRPPKTENGNQTNETKSFAEAAAKYIGRVKSGVGDLSTNKKYLEDLGRD